MMPETEFLVTVGACAIDDPADELQAIFWRGHHPPWGLRREAEEFLYGGQGEEPGWPRREWWQEVPYSLVYPDEPPCDGGEESILFIPCKRAGVGAFAVTVLYA